ncbi:MAG TPA: chromosome segregation protein SMC [Terriglobales bacterium]|nr:chromosome segregation protein SMC [Terriglobales bacterium]
MLKLKKLQILGFKSFCDRTELKFHGDGIAAIVGPNGCGKSNISDAIMWVLGEQSAKSLRGARMEDVIFAGTRDRTPNGMAEVSLTLIDPEVYEGGTSDLTAEPEIEIRDEMPEEDWDETALRTEAAAEAARIAEEVHPHQKYQVPGGRGQEAGSSTQEAGDATSQARDTESASAETAGTASEAASDAAEGGRAPQVEPASAEPQVVLKVRRRKFNQIEFKKGQIVVTRRLFRSGDSEYLLNGKLCRLRDIQDIFMGTGLGPESYAIIEQGRIGQILSSKPHDRRAIIEEAAGITKFKTKKRLAEMRLEEAKLNLARVNDIFEEVTRQMNSLRRQAAKADRYARLREEMRAKLRLVLASRSAQMEREQAALRAELERVTEEMRARGESVQQMEAEHRERTQRGYAIETEARRAGDRLNEIGREIDRATQRQKTNEERCAELAARAAAAEAEIAHTEAQLTSLRAEVEANRTTLESASGEVAAAQQEAALRQQEAASASSALLEVERLQEQRRLQVLEAVGAASNVRNQMAQAEEQAAALDREASRLNQELEAASAQIESFGGRRGQMSMEFETVQQRVNGLDGQIGEARRRLESRRETEVESKKRLDTLRAEYATLLGKKGSLESVIAEHGYSTESVKRLFQSGVLNAGFAPAGVLADFLEVEDRYEPVVEDFLRDELNYVVVKSWDAADAGLAMLRSDVNGRATFLVHPNDAQAKFSFVVDESTRHAPRREQEVVPLKSCIRVLNGFGKSLEMILPKLGNGYITANPAVARELALENPDAFFLATSGECFHNVTVTGGKQRSEGPLSMKRDLREVLRHLEQVEQGLREEEARVGLLAREIRELSSLLERLEEEKREAERLALTSGHALQQLDTEMARTNERLGTYRAELARVSDERAAKVRLASERRSEAETHEQRRASLEGETTAAQETLITLKVTRDAAAHTAAEMASKVAVLEERRTAAAANLHRIESMAADVEVRVMGLREQVAAAAAERQHREQENTQLAEQLAGLADEGIAMQARSQELQAESGEVRERLSELEAALRELRQALDAARDRRGEITAQAAKLDSDRSHLSETAVNELGLTTEQLRADASIVQVEGEPLVFEEQAYREMKARLEAMGPVNMMALEEYKETAQRHEFLETQRKDLLESIENTQNTIREIETFSRQKFQEAFDRINENFQETFKKLFGGGQALMRLTDLENTTESGIDVVASPPGKKLQNVLLLSGGEKALTALALLVGIFQYQPSPFCILDEVDAPLDDANVGRFVELVKEMSARTQFILITHSKKTMTAAPVMYGVTMQEPGVSKLVSVRFGENVPEGMRVN